MKEANEAESLIRRLKLRPHPEGGYYREIHRSPETVGTSKGTRSALTTIYFLLLRGQKSVFHRVLSDEVWNHYAGAPLRLIRVAADFRSRESILLGPIDTKKPKGRKGGTGPKSPGAKGMPVAVIPRKDWQAAESLGEFTLVGCSVGPGFDFADFRMMRDDAIASRKLGEAFPGLRKWI
jgi:predicted cupin superfamily sugar epimerase